MCSQDGIAETLTMKDTIKRMIATNINP